jgi:tRNA dimethylallyltransferase
MQNSNTNPLRPIVILGPTAGGKSELAVRLAEQLNGQILGADSMQVYRHMDAGTAKPEPELLARAKHHLINIIEPTESFSVNDWLSQANPLIVQLLNENIRPIVVGGTNLYLKALLEGLFEGPSADPQLREKLVATPNPILHQQLKEIDPDAAQRIHPNDQKRLVRALEVFHTTGKTITQMQEQWSDTPGQTSYHFNPILIGLRWEVPNINKRINKRVKMMFHPPQPPEAPDAQEGSVSPESLPDETRRLEDAGLLGVQAREALGYKQVLEHFAGKYSLYEAQEKTKILTRRFAKAQRTWLKRFMGVHWLDADHADMGRLTDAALAAVAAS